MENVVPGTHLSKAAVILIVSAWIVLLTVTHWGDRSPYSYGWALMTDAKSNSDRISGAVVNPDAMDVPNVTQFFYAASGPEWPVAHNLKLPLHSFTASIGMAFTRSYLLANYLANVVFAIVLAIAAVNFADRHAVPRIITLVTLLTVFSLPLFMDYLGQPVQYVIGPAASFLVILALVANEERNPWILGLAASILYLNYDPYVFLAALATYVLFVVRLRRVRDYAILVLVMAVPLVLWRQYLERISGGKVTRLVRQHFIEPVFDGWGEILTNPFDSLLQPFVTTHIGVHVAFHQLIAMIYWPLVAVCVFLLIRLRPRIATGFVLIALLPLFHFLEQMVAAAWDYELNPRRAIPAMLTFAVAWVWCAVRVWPQRGWRIAFVALMAMSMFFAMSDTLLQESVMPYLRTGQAMQYKPQHAIQIEDLRLTRQGLPKMMQNEKVQWRDTERARVERWGVFAAAQAVGLFVLAGLFWLCGRAGLLPRWSALAALGVWAASMVRFI